MSSRPTQPSSHFYVVIPPEDQAISNDISKAVSSSSELTAIMKRNPRARFMAANTAEEAMKKALEKIQFSRDTESITSPPPSAAPSKRKGRQSFSAVDSSIGAPAIESPKTGELLMMGREIITRRNDKVFEKIAKNPRILCTDTEFPTILQEGCKYNAVHLAAKSDNVEVLKHILNLASSIDFIRRIYPNQNEESLVAASKHLINCYLNSPDKMLQETPLHFACKFNSVECAQVLLSHPLTDTTLRNFEKRTAFDLIGSRDEAKSANATAIRRIFSQRYIVPIWRDLAVDGEAPVLGETCFISDLGQSIPDPLVRTNFPDFSFQLLDPCKPTIAPKPTSSSIKVFTSQPISWKIQAYAGPMEESKAKEFRTIMKRSKHFLSGIPTSTPESSLNLQENVGGETGMVTPPGTPTGSRRRMLSQGTPPPNTHFFMSPIRSPLSRRSVCESSLLNTPRKNDITVRVRDVEKGLERIASEYCEELGIPWVEYWKFLGEFCDLTSEAGLDKLEEHFKYLERQAKDKSSFANGNSSGPHQRSNSCFLDDVINKLQNVRLSESGMSTPEKKDGSYCSNPNCRLESRFCNCEDVVPAIPYEDEDDFDPAIFTYGDDFQGNTPFADGASLGIRKLDITSNTDSFDVSDPFQQDQDFDWPLPQVDIDCFKTAPSSPAEVEDKDVFEECDSVELFLSGDAAGKLDFQVFQILRESDANVDPYKHLITFQWLNSMRSYGNQIMPPYCTPAPRTPNRSWAPSFMSTPRRITAAQSLDFSF